ncbi:hypothetical protein [Geodermatophilus maliterrae]|uniref:Uncharacterized protein n=1 Tax=Geodermatophilus maliterrae TaxID=3162531 RepID=A0ABV3X9Y1_9ACTN
MTATTEELPPSGPLPTPGSIPLSWRTPALNTGAAVFDDMRVVVRSHTPTGDVAAAVPFAWHSTIECVLDFLPQG